MPSLSAQTKITVGLAIVIAGVIFNTGYFYAKQEALAARVNTLESDREKTVQMSEDIAVIKEKVASMDARVTSILTKVESTK